MMEFFRYNFNQCRFIPRKLYNEVWDTYKELDQDFWNSDVRHKLEQYLGERVFEIHRYTAGDAHCNLETTNNYIYF